MDINCQNQYVIASLHVACEQGAKKAIVKLIHAGANSALLDNDKNNALHYMVRTENNDDDLCSLVMFFLVSNIFDVNAPNVFGTTALHLACQHCNYKFVKMLLSEGARTDISDNDSNTALHYACSSAKPNEKIIYLLLRRGLNVNAPNKNGTSPFHLAFFKFRNSARSRS